MIVSRTARLASSRLACVFLAAWLAAAPVRAESIEGVEFAERVRIGGASLALSSLALLRYRILFKGYVGALYLPLGTASERALEDVPKRLEIEYFWSIDGEAIARAGDEIVARSVTPETLEALRPRLDAINALYRDVSPGDRYALSYVPGRGTELSKDGEVLGVIPGADFARAYFAIWLGEDPIDEAFREQLLEGRSPPR